MIFFNRTNRKNTTEVAVSKHDKLEKLISEYQQQLKFFIRKRVSDKNDAEDILQDVFYQLIKTVNNAIDPIEHAAAWLYRVTRNTIINHGRKKRDEAMPVMQSRDGDDEAMQDISEIIFDCEFSSSPEIEYLRSLVWDELENALSELPPQQREIFELTELEGISMKEISNATGISINTLLSRKHYAVLHLRTRMRELYNDIISS
ncbi:MAG: sigma-70 family RNA polymerase sigma factor [Prevotellaceae bacterium]|jgi:RNA polymerase sigma factor (sigma-70 family)|nr:sigma-70 family RNA polymerase sigma factor [Prevotellaceae bacterium]